MIKVRLIRNKPICKENYNRNRVMPGELETLSEIKGKTSFI